MIASFLFVAYAFYRLMQSPANVQYSRLILIALLFSFIGDFFLGYASVKEKNATRLGIIGGAAFFLTHVFLLYSYFSVNNVWNKATFWIIFAVNLSVLGGLLPVLKVKFGRLLPLVVVYISAISLMTATAMYISLALGQIPLLLTLGLGAILFEVSDFTLSLKIFSSERFDNFAVRVIYASAYFMAQMLIGTSVLFMS